MPLLTQATDFDFQSAEVFATGHDVQNFFAADFAAQIGSPAAPAIEQREPVRDGVGVMDVVRDEDDAEAAIRSEERRVGKECRL